MKCADPILCYSDGVKKQFRHFSLATPIFKIKHNLVFNCGKCVFCRKKKAAELAVRCVLHASLYQHNCFLTLTYDEKQEGYHNEFHYKDIQDFKKRLRSHVQYHYDKKVQVFNVHEYGKNGKKHWHLVLFNHGFDDRVVQGSRGGNSYFTSEVLTGLWPYGFHIIGDVTEASAMYTAQYTQKDLKHGNTLNEKRSHSKHSGIGRDYFLKHYAQILRLGFIPFNGRKIPIPRYFHKLAHKHFSHFYEPGNFFDNDRRKRLYTPFKDGQANRHMAELFQQYYSDKQKKIEQLTLQWEEEIEAYIWSKDKPPFLQAAENHLYDLGNKNSQSNF